MSNRYYNNNVIDLSSVREDTFMDYHEASTNEGYDIENIQTIESVQELEEIDYLALSEEATEEFAQPSLKPSLDINEVIKASPQLVEILELYFSEAKQLLNIEGLLFVNQEYKLRQKFGTSQTAYNCGFCLLSDYDDNLGELILFRKKRFTEQELDQIDLLIHLMTTPLTKAMRRQRLQVS